jgi:hypothetical protein
MLAWVGEHGYDPRDLNRRYDVELRGIPIARACCGTMPNIVKKQSDYSGLPSGIHFQNEALFHLSR